MPDPDGTEPESRGGRATAPWVVAVVLVAAATGVLVLSDDARLLRLGLVAALWAALIAAFAVARLRNRVADDEDRADELQRIYELELEREVAARREFELEAENEARRRVTEESENEVQALRAELRNLRESLERVLGGDVLFERVALRAESTRVRSLQENGGAGKDNRVIQPREGWGRELPAAGNGQHAPEPNTQLINRLSDEPQRAPSRPAPARPQQPRERAEPPRKGGFPVWSGGIPDEPRAPTRGREVARPHNGSPVEVAAPPKARTDVEDSGGQVAGQQEAPTAAESPEKVSTGWTSQVDAGAHAEGTSVTELLAAYGNSGDTGRRRRRRE
jgi:hypothetical protein